MNAQFAVKPGGDGEEDAIYVLEVNPRASRTAPFVAKGDGRSGRQTGRARHGW